MVYLKAHGPESGLFVDISSTGATWQKLNADIRIKVPMYSDPYFYTREKPKLPDSFSFITRNSACGQTNILLEVFNCGDHGYLNYLEMISAGLMKSKFDPIQIDKALIEELHKPVRLAENLAFIYREKISNELRLISTSELLALISRFLQVLCGHTHLANHLRRSTYFGIEIYYKIMSRDAETTLWRS